MILNIDTLSDVSLPELTRTFNTAFNDYLVRLQFSEEQMLQKLKMENVQMSLSYGAFHQNELVAFILHAVDVYYYPGCVYNAGTGVIPGYRGQRIIEKIYEVAMKELHHKGFSRLSLEVAIANKRAYTIYRHMGFCEDRELISYKGKLNFKSLGEHCVKEKRTLDFRFLRSFWDIQPTWQNDLPCLLRIIERLTIYYVENEGGIIGYCIVNVETGRIYQIAVKQTHRKTGVASSLCAALSMGQVQKEFSLINVDKNNTAIHQFLLKVGFTPFITQYDMKCLIKKRAFE